MKISLDILKEANQRGIIIGPNESTQSFAKRFSKKIKQAAWSVPSMDLYVDWVRSRDDQRSFFSAAHIELDPAEGEATLFLNRKSYIPLHEQVQHEVVHAARICFEEARFEELLAFRTSSSLLRRFWGPLLASPFDSLVLVMLCFVHFIGAWLGYYFSSIVPLMSFLLFRVAQLLFNQRILKHATENITQIFEENPDILLCRLTDQEIVQFAKMDLTRIGSYIRCNHSLRWKQIKACYCFKKKLDDSSSYS